jgi:sporulation protein YlmC with PRC-barrel domain
MKRTLLVAALGLIGTLCVLDPAAAREAGATTVGVETIQFDSLAPGWSVKRSILGRTVYNDAGEKVGRIDDLIVDPAKGVSHLIVGVGGFIGMGLHQVAITTTSLREQGARIVVTGASKSQITAMAGVKSMPRPLTQRPSAGLPGRRGPTCRVA